MEDQKPKKPEAATKKERACHLRWVRINEMRVSPTVQRKFSKNHAETIAAEFDLEALGYIVVSLRDSHYWIVDGQHRVAALKLIGYDDQMIECECYEGLTEAEEAELFLRRDERVRISAFERFRLGVEAGRPVECDIAQISTSLGVNIAEDGQENSIGAVGAVYEVYRRGPGVYARTLKIIRDALAGDSKKFQGDVVRGIGRAYSRYNGALPDDVATVRLGALKGSSELIKRAYALHEKSARTMPDCVASTFIDVVNMGLPRGKKLAKWWS